MIESLQKADQFLFLAINSFHFVWLNAVMIFFSGKLFWIPLIIFVLWKSKIDLNTKSMFLFIILALMAVSATDATSSSILKNIVTRLRPCRIPDLKTLTNFFGQKCGGKYGFVSSHAANAMALVSFTYFSLRLSRRSFWWLWLYPVVVGWSRVYLGVHYPGDIVGGFIVGLSWGLFFYWFFKNRAKVQVAQASTLKASASS